MWIYRLGHKFRTDFKFFYQNVTYKIDKAKVWILNFRDDENSNFYRKKYRKKYRPLGRFECLVLKTNNPLLILLLYSRIYKAILNLYAQIKQKYQTWIIYRKLTVAMFTILDFP
jgi:hypothetical protein